MSEIVEVRIKGIVSTARYGTLEAGDILRTDAAFAKHLVEQCGAGEYVAKAKEEAKSKEEVKSKEQAKTKSNYTK